MARTAIVKTSKSLTLANRELAPIQRAARMKIRTEEEYRGLGEFMKRCDKFLASAVVRALKEDAKAAKAEHARACMVRDQFINEAKECKRIFGEKRVEYRVRRNALLEKARLKAIVRAQKEAERAAKKRARQLHARGEHRAAKELLARVKNMQLSIPAVTVPKEKGFVEKISYEFLIVNREIIPRKYWSVDARKIKADVDAFGLDANIPGIEITQKKTEHTRKTA